MMRKQPKPPPRPASNSTPPTAPWFLSLPPQRLFTAIQVFLVFSLAFFTAPALSLAFFPPLFKSADTRAVADAAPAGDTPTGQDSPFGISGVRYPLSNNEQQFENISYLVKSTGGSWVRGSTLAWGLVEKEKGVYDWQTFDRLVQRCQREDIYLLVNIAPFARWDQGDKKTKPKDMPAFLAFLEKFVERYDFDGIDDMPGLDRGLHHLEILNEPMAVGHFFDGSAEDFLDILKQSYPVIKKASPQCQLLLAGLADVENNSIRGLPPIFSAHHLTKKYTKTYHAYYDLLHEMGVEKYYDIMNIHVYDTQLRDVLSYYRQFGKPIWITETSVSPKKTTQNQAEGVIKRFVEGLALGAEKIFWFSLLNDSPAARMGIYDENKRPRETFFAYRLLVDKLKHSDWRRVETIPVQPPGAHCYLFYNKHDKSRTWVAWTEGSEPVEIEINTATTATTAKRAPTAAPTAKSFTLTPVIVPTIEEKNSLLSARFSGQTVNAQRGALKIRIDSTPLFIEEGTLPAALIEMDQSRILPDTGQPAGRPGHSPLPKREQQPRLDTAFNHQGQERAPALLPQRHLEAHHAHHAPLAGGQRPLFGIIVDISGDKISFRSFKGDALVVFTDSETKFTRERHYPLEADELRRGDGVVLILREPRGADDKPFASLIDKLPPKGDKSIPRN